MTFLHQLSHRLGLNAGQVETWTTAAGIHMVGFRCSCGDLRSVEPMPAWLQDPPMQDNADLLTTRLHALIDHLRDPAFCDYDGTMAYANRMTADAIEFAMFGGVAGSVPVSPALDRRRKRAA